MVSLALEGEGFRVESAATGTQALELWHRRSPDLILLDLMVPEIDGIEICRRIRHEDSDVPIVMLTAKDDPVDVVVGLETGADDYVTKPFETRVLIARLRTALRRRHRPDVQDGRILRVGDLEIDQAAVEVRRRAQPVDLTPTEYRLLVELARRPG